MRSRDHEAERQAEEAKKKITDSKSQKEADAQEAAKTLGDVEAMINALENDADLEQAVQAAGGVQRAMKMGGRRAGAAAGRARAMG